MVTYVVMIKSSNTGTEEYLQKTPAEYVGLLTQKCRNV
jgi:hypothetical protein